MDNLLYINFLFFRVKFGDDPLGIHQPHIYTSATDTSLKMNQLAAKYLKNRPVLTVPQQVPAAVKHQAPFDMSFATKNYMERHQLLQGVFFISLSYGIVVLEKKLLARARRWL